MRTPASSRFTWKKKRRNVESPDLGRGRDTFPFWTVSTVPFFPQSHLRLCFLLVLSRTSFTSFATRLLKLLQKLFHKPIHTRQMPWGLLETWFHISALANFLAWLLSWMRSLHPWTECLQHPMTLSLLGTLSCTPHKASLQTCWKIQ